MGYKVLLGPGFGAVGVETECEVAVKTDGHIALRACNFGYIELPVRLPLQILVKCHAICMIAREHRRLRRIGISVLRWPMAPRKMP